MVKKYEKQFNFLGPQASIYQSISIKVYSGALDQMDQNKHQGISVFTG